MAESGLRPAESLLNNRSRRKLMSLPKGNQAKSLPGCNTAMGQRMVHFSEYSSRVEEIYLPEDGPTELGTRTSIANAEWAEQEARKADSQPGLVLWTDGSRDENGAVGYICGGGIYMRRRGGKDRAGLGERPIWDTTRRRTTRSARPLRALSTW